MVLPSKPSVSPLPLCRVDQSFPKAPFKEIAETDLALVKKQVAKDLGRDDTEFLDSGLEQLKHFYGLCFKNPTQRFAVSNIVDPFWHAHVLHTRSYTDFCNRVFGRYLHHEPLHHDDELAVANADEVYRCTRAAMISLYGQIDNEWWPADSAVCLGDFIATECSNATEQVAVVASAETQPFSAVVHN